MGVFTPDLPSTLALGQEQIVAFAFPCKVISRRCMKVGAVNAAERPTKSIYLFEINEDSPLFVRGQRDFLLCSLHHAWCV